MTLTRTRVLDLLAAHGLDPSRALGQNFVADPNTVRRIARLADISPGDRVVEIGPGLGSLTLALVEEGARVTAVEADRHLLPVLEEVVAPHGVRVVHEDATTADWEGLLDDAERAEADAADGGDPAAGWALVANLPYNVATHLVLDVLADVPRVRTMLVMVQREVAERMVAPAGSRTYGIPSVKVAWYATGEIVGRVPPTVFVPRPRVESALVRLRRRDHPPHDVDPDELFDLVQKAFGQRRKMLRRSLAGVVAPEVFAAAGIDPQLRPEQLDLAAWAALTAAVHAGGGAADDGVGRDGGAPV
ncbi:MAG: 16S rRNA (adenine(1518)-N(6)/adenine(1519)-N(6))-dimethyltransferase RsmA [Actinomycetota bacterium]|nr:16S rRNA (adenine(1518)-N(6)/adenine(1519)-N(6))-dimethyltransferase RsmA [Actinomycetota bacterium]